MEQSADLIAARAVLGVEADATKQQIRLAFRQRAALLHPDLHQQRPSARGPAERAMAQLNEAYRTLLDHPGTTDADAPVFGHESGRSPRPWRCPSCSTIFRSTSSMETVCPGCGGRLKRRNRSAQPEADHESGRSSVVYSFAEWPDELVRSFMNQLDAADLSHRWDGKDLVVDEPYERFVDTMIDLVDRARNERRAAGSDAQHVEYDFAGWSHTAIAHLVRLLCDHAIPSEWSAQRLSILERYESDVDDLVAAVQNDERIP